MKVDSNVNINISDNQHSCNCEKPLQNTKSNADSLLKVYENINNREGSLVDSILGIFKNDKTHQCVLTGDQSTEASAENTETSEIETCKDGAHVKKPGKKSYQQMIRKFVKPGEDGKIGEKEMRVGLIKYSLYQYDKKTLKVFNKNYEKNSRLHRSLSKLVDRGLISQKDIDWIKSYTASAAETNRDLDSNQKVDVELSNKTRHNYENIINWSEANLAHIIHGNVIV